MGSLSVLIPTKNEENNIKRCIDSVESIADEVLVLDNYSDDCTVEISRECGAKVIQKEFTGFADNRRELLDAAECEWVLFIDADEVVSEELSNSIQSVLRENKRAAYRVQPRVKMFGTWLDDTDIGGPGVRFGPKEGIRVEDDIVHEAMAPTEKYKNNVITLNGALRHHTYDSVSEYISKFDQYTSLEALKREDEGKMLGFLQSVTKGILVAVYYLIGKKGILGGKSAILFASMSFQYRLVTYWKQRELKQLRTESPKSWREKWIKNECQR